MKRLILLSLATVLVFALGAGAYLWRGYQDFTNTALPITEDDTFMLVKGTGFSTLTQQLVDNGWVENPYYFKLLGRRSQLGSKLKAGEYAVTKGMTPLALLQLLASGRSIQYRFTLIEGSNYRELRERLAKDSRLNQTLSSLTDAQLLEKLNSEAKHPEGLFLAETYMFQRGDSDFDILKRAHKLLNQQLNKEWAVRKEKKSYNTAYQALTMASIIEKETAQPSERPIIAGVFVRRLAIGMRLQTDPTVIYGMGESYKGNIRRSDLRKPTPYNTYVIKGLPPTPIAMVGREAIQAALNPTMGKALYFVAKGDGSHAFSNSLVQHNRAVRKYQLKRRKNYRSAPEKN